jgi:hypothetical protein
VTAVALLNGQEICPTLLSLNLTLNSRDELHTLEPVDKNLQAAVVAHQEADLTVGIGFLQSNFF